MLNQGPIYCVRLQIQGTKLTPLKSFLPGSTMGAKSWHIKPEVPEIEGLVSWSSTFGSKNLVCQISGSYQFLSNQTFKSFGGRKFTPSYGQRNITMDTAIIKHVNGNLPVCRWYPDANLEFVLRGLIVKLASSQTLHPSLTSHKSLRAKPAAKKKGWWLNYKTKELQLIRGLWKLIFGSLNIYT